MQIEADEEIRLKKIEDDAQMSPRQASNDLGARVNRLPESIEDGAEDFFE